MSHLAAATPDTSNGISRDSTRTTHPGIVGFFAPRRISPGRESRERRAPMNRSNPQAGGKSPQTAAATGRKDVAGPMSFDASLDLALLGVMLACSVFPARSLRPGLPWGWHMISVLSGAACILFAILGRRGARWCSLGARATLAVAASALVSQTVLYWSPSEAGPTTGPRIPIMTIVLCVFCLGTFQKIARDRGGPLSSAPPEE